MFHLVGNGCQWQGSVQMPIPRYVVLRVVKHIVWFQRFVLCHEREWKKHKRPTVPQHVCIGTPRISKWNSSRMVWRYGQELRTKSGAGLSSCALAGGFFMSYECFWASCWEHSALLPPCFSYGICDIKWHELWQALGTLNAPQCAALTLIPPSLWTSGLWPQWVTREGNPGTLTW